MVTFTVNRIRVVCGRFSAKCFFCIMFFLCLSQSGGAQINMSRATLELLQEDGFQVRDIVLSEWFAIHYNSDFREMLELRREGTTWFEIAHSFGFDLRRVNSSSEDIDHLLSIGFGAEEIIVASFIAGRFDTGTAVTLAMKEDHGRWITLFWQMYEKEQSLTKGVNVDHDFTSKVEISDASNSIVLESLARGVGAADIEKAFEFAQEGKLPFELLLAAKSPHTDWSMALNLAKYLFESR